MSRSVRTSIGRITQEQAEKCLALADQGPVKTPLPAARVSEAAFMAAIIDLAARNGWAHYHTRDSRKSVAGFPDLVLVRRYVLWLECKTETGEPTADQLTWAERLIGAGQDYRLVRPSDWPEIVATLEGQK